MSRPRLRQLAAIFLGFLSTTNARLISRSISTNSDDINGHAFDYIIVGGGAAGLVLAARLSEDSSKRVALIEAGDSGEDVMDRILTPALAYLNGIAVPNSPNDWGYYSNSLERWLHQPRGKILGGSTAVNALYMVRASAVEHDSWASLLPDAEEDWSWNGFFPYMIKTENFTPPLDLSLTSTQVNDSAHGHNGPVHASYPQYTYDSAARWTATMSNLGLKTSDPQGGQGWGGFLTPNSINPADGTRSYAKTAYLDPASQRGNLVVLLEHQVTKITFDTSGAIPRATGVQFAKAANGTVYSCETRGEVILAAGVFGTPQLLQLSGIGPRALLESKGVPVIVDLPGVGEHFQDHVLVPVTWAAIDNTTTGDLLVQNETFRDEQLQLFKKGDLAHSLMSAPNNGIGYVSLKQLFSNDSIAAAFVQQLKDNMTLTINNLNLSDPTVRAGYELTYSTEVEKVINSDVGVVELLLSSFGSWNVNQKTISIQVSLQHPMSRGWVRINSTNAFEAPIITANYLNTDADYQIMRAGVRYLRRVAATEPLSGLVLQELQPGIQVQSDQDIDNFIYQNAGTQYHPASTSSMLPLEKGGVVDARLKVYHTDGLRVIDSSVIPIGLCAHLMVPTYAIAEKGVGIIQVHPTNPRQANSAGKTIPISTVLVSLITSLVTILATSL